MEHPEASGAVIKTCWSRVKAVYGMSRGRPGALERLSLTCVEDLFEAATAILERLGASSGGKTWHSILHAALDQ